MSAKTRGLLLISLTIIFVVAGTALVLYSRGARFDFENWEIVQTGGIYLKTEPADVQIQLDGKPKKNQSGFLQSGTLINNLKPGTYKVTVQAKDYHSWQKEIRVLSSTVAVLDGIILFPQKEAELVASPTDKFLLELGGEKMSEAEFSQLSILFNQLKERQLRLPGAVSIKKILPYPYNELKFIILTDRALYLLDTEKRTLSQITLHAEDFTISGNEVFWLEDKGVFSFNLILRNQTQINLPENLRPTEWKRIELAPSGELMAILKDNNELTIWDRATNKITSFGKDHSHFVFSPDSKKIAFANDNLLSVYVIKDGAFKEKFILENISGDWSEIQEITWHEDNNYLFLKDSRDKLYFVEVNEYPPVNVVEVAGEVKNFAYNKDNDSLYWQDPRGIWQVKL